MSFIEQLRKNAAPKGKTIVFPEGTEKRTLEAVAHILAGNIVKPILLGSEAQIMQLAAELGTSLAGAQIIDPQTAPQAAEYADAYFQLRQHKGISREDARNAVENPLFFAAFLVRNGIADGAVAGAENTTGDVMKAAIQVVGLAKNMSVVSSSFLMMMPDGQILTFADCAVVPDPNPEQLASIAAAAAGTHEKLTAEKPKIALLSFSTMGSAKHPLADKVIAAKAIAARNFPHLDIDGEMQFDAAFIPAIGQKKAPNSPVAGKANVFVFPDLNAGNIGYKLVQRLAKAEAIGPVVQGLAKPYNDLSRGCSVDDIVNVAAICALNS
jgi:phosphate acetyltransferase